jgi:aspartyl-tRNA(Asn)/glutamyl-tRNA(Gln) amidotransferase subunit A
LAADRVSAAADARDRLSWHRVTVAWTTDDCAILLQAMAGYDPRDPASVSYSPPDHRTALQASVKGLRVGLIRHFYERDNVART